MPNWFDDVKNYLNKGNNLFGERREEDPYEGRNSLQKKLDGYFRRRDSATLGAALSQAQIAKVDRIFLNSLTQEYTRRDRKEHRSLNMDVFEQLTFHHSTKNNFARDKERGVKGRFTGEEVRVFYYSDMASILSFIFRKYAAVLGQRDVNKNLHMVENDLFAIKDHLYREGIKSSELNNQQISRSLRQFSSVEIEIERGLRQMGRIEANQKELTELKDNFGSYHVNWGKRRGLASVVQILRDFGKPVTIFKDQQLQPLEVESLSRHYKEAIRAVIFCKNVYQHFKLAFIESFYLKLLQRITKLQEFSLE